MLLQRISRQLLFAMAFAVLTSLALALIPLGNIFSEGPEQRVSLITAALFWIFLILEQVFFWIANSGRKKIQKKAFGGRKLVKPTLGLISFGCNKEGRIADIVFFTTFIATICLIIFQVQNRWLVTTVLALFLLSFTFHCIFNGTTYRYIKAFQNIKKEPKKHENR